jgi:hypothetical protein
MRINCSVQHGSRGFARLQGGCIHQIPAAQCKGRERGGERKRGGEGLAHSAHADRINGEASFRAKVKDLVGGGRGGGGTRTRPNCKPNSTRPFPENTLPWLRSGCQTPNLRYSCSCRSAFSVVTESISSIRQKICLITCMVGLQPQQHIVNLNRRRSCKYVGLKTSIVHQPDHAARRRVLRFVAEYMVQRMRTVQLLRLEGGAAD